MNHFMLTQQRLVLVVICAVIGTAMLVSARKRLGPKGTGISAGALAYALLAGLAWASGGAIVFAGYVADSGSLNPPFGGGTVTLNTSGCPYTLTSTDYAPDSISFLQGTMSADCTVTMPLGNGRWKKWTNETAYNVLLTNGTSTFTLEPNESAWVGQVDTSANMNKVELRRAPTWLPVTTVATTNQSLTGAATIAGYTVTTGDRVLLTGQTTTTQNGIYNANTSGAWNRVSDAAYNDQFAFGGLVVVANTSSTYADTIWVDLTAGITTQTWIQASGGSGGGGSVDAASIFIAPYQVDGSAIGNCVIGGDGAAGTLTCETTLPASVVGNGLLLTQVDGAAAGTCVVGGNGTAGGLSCETTIPATVVGNGILLTQLDGAAAGTCVVGGSGTAGGLTCETTISSSLLPNGISPYLLDGAASPPGVLSTDGGAAGVSWTPSPSLQSVAWQGGYGPNFTATTDTFPSNANYVSPSATLNHYAIMVTGTQTDKQYIVPCNVGDVWWLGNATTGRMQVVCSFDAGGVYGTSTWAWISAGDNAFCKVVEPDGGIGSTAVYCANQSSSALTTQNDIGASTSSSVVKAFVEDEVCFASKTNSKPCTASVTVALNDSTNWVTTFGPYTPPVSNEQDDCYTRFEAHDVSGLTDGGLAIDGGGTAGGTVTSLNVAKFNLEFHIQQTQYLSDGGLGTTLYVTAQAANPGQQTSSATLLPLSITDTHGCTTTYGSTGCASTGPTTFTAQALISDGGVYEQVKMGAQQVAWPWNGEAVTTCVRRIPGP
jgi:hypothetical protein